MQHKGFSLIEIVSQCPTQFGRYALKTGDPVAVLKWIEENTYIGDVSKSAEVDPYRLRMGEYICVDRPVYAGTTEME